MSTQIDILGLGAVAVDDLIYVDSYPPANSKVRVLDRERQCGGLTATALVAASRLGCRCAYAGMMGTDEESDYALAALAREGVSIDKAVRRAGRRIHHSTIVVDLLGNRTLFSDGRNVQNADEDWPEAGVLRSGKILFVDHTGIPGVIRAARIARSSGIPVVADVERTVSESVDELISLTDHLIVPEEFAVAVTGRDNPGDAATSLQSRNRHTVVVTCGESGSWYTGGGGPTRQQAYRVEVVDTTGCGDVFHGAYAAGLVMGMGLPERVRLASAAAALKATRHGGQAGCPTFAEVESFLCRTG